MAGISDEEYRRSLKDLERKVFDFFTLSQLGKSLISIQDMDNLARVFASSVYEVSRTTNVALLIYDIDKKAYTYHYSIGLDQEQIQDVQFQEEEGLFWQVINGGEPFAIRDSAGNYRFNEIIQKNRLHLLDSEVWVPLMVKNMLRGVLTLGKRRDKSSYTDPELIFISQLAAQASIAIESALLDQQKQRATVALGKKMENLSVLYDVSKAMNFANDLKKTLLLILDKSRSAVKAQKGSIMLLNKDTSELEVKVVRGIDPLTEKKINDGEIECTKIKLGEGIAGRVAQAGKHMVVDNTKNSEQFKQSKNSNVDNIVCLPLVAADECIGVMNITNKEGSEKFSDDDVSLLITLAGQAAITINNANLYQLAITDGMTQLFINRYFHQKLQEEIRRSQRYKRPVALIFSDIDHFKKFNDTYGHQQGDAVLITTAKIFRESIRDTDIPCRYGGEEFAIILPETGHEQALEVAERLRKNIEAYEFPALQGKPLKVTLSLGVATYPLHAENEPDLIKKADLALYACKEAGRNCVRIFSPDMQPSSKSE
jgi:diguanylate cyclase (GGDEF)-like protein